MATGAPCRLDAAVMPVWDGRIVIVQGSAGREPVELYVAGGEAESEDGSGRMDGLGKEVGRERESTYGVEHLGREKGEEIVRMIWRS